jgi:trehalose 6-phosphate synthase/phosphatase
MNYWAHGPFVRSFILLVDPGDICPPHFGFAFSVNAGTVAYQLRSRLPANAPVLHIGTLLAAAAEAASDELSDYLLANFSCLPVYLHHRFYHGFCKHYL